jgi:hypothetical protein
MDENAGQKNSPGYRLAALDPDFLLGDSMRGVRLHLEYEKAEGRLRAWVVRSTIVVFGSARVLPRGSADETESTAPLPPRAVPRPGDQSARWYEEARRFGRIASERGGALRPRDDRAQHCRRARKCSRCHSSRTTSSPLRGRNGRRRGW